MKTFGIHNVNVKSEPDFNLIPPSKESTIDKALKFLEAQKQAIAFQVSKIQLNHFNKLRIALKDKAPFLCDGLKSVVLDKDERSDAEAALVLMALTTPKHYKDETYLYLCNISTESLPLGQLRKDWLNLLKLLYQKCFKPAPNFQHIIGIMNAEDLDLYTQKEITDRCRELLSEAIAQHIFQNAQQIILGDQVIPIPTIQVLVETLAANSYHVNKHYKRKERIKSKLDPESDYYDPNLLARLEARKANAKVTRQKRNGKRIQSVKEKSGEKLRILRQLSLNKANSSSSSSSSSGSSSSNSEPNLSLEGIYPESDDDSDKENLEQLEEEMDDFVQTDGKIAGLYIRTD